jgi:hypothetical protein
MLPVPEIFQRQRGDDSCRRLVAAGCQLGTPKSEDRLDELIEVEDCWIGKAWC